MRAFGSVTPLSVRKLSFTNERCSPRWAGCGCVCGRTPPAAASVRIATSDRAYLTTRILPCSLEQQFRRPGDHVLPRERRDRGGSFTAGSSNACLVSEVV